MYEPPVGTGTGPGGTPGSTPTPTPPPIYDPPFGSRPTPTPDPTITPAPLPAPDGNGGRNCNGRPCATSTAGPPCGSLDESARPFPPAERRLADYLVAQCKNVKSRPETGTGRHADAEVDGVVTEFKTSIAGTSTAITRSVGDSLSGTGQARHIIVDARGTGLIETEALRTFRRVAGLPNIAKLDSLRIVGNGFDVSTNYPYTGP